MTHTTASRRRWLQHSASLGLAWATLQTTPAIAQKMESGKLLSLAEMLLAGTVGVDAAAPIAVSAHTFLM